MNPPFNCPLKGVKECPCKEVEHCPLTDEEFVVAYLINEEKP